MVVFASRALEENKLAYSTYELEFLAGKFAFNVFHNSVHIWRQRELVY